MSNTERIVALIDMDCFYCQVEENLDQSLVGKPIAVVQYNQWKGGGIIAVNYIAREKGVTRQMRGEEAREKCPDIQLPQVPQVRGKADLTKYREAGKKVAEVLMTFTNILERASIDEAYLDLTEGVNNELKKGMPIISSEDLSNTFVVGCETSDFLTNIYQNQNSGFCDDDLKLALGGVIVEKVRAEVFKKTGYKCSAGIAHNKTLAKLVCSLHKPNKQTILPHQAVPEMFATLPLRKIKNLGGKFGHTLSEKLNINFIGELLKFSEKDLIQTFDEKTGRWLFNMARGIDKEPVQIKLISKSIGCCKRFPGRSALCKPEEVEHWMKELSCEISERLEEDLGENNRKGRLMTVGFGQETNQTDISSTRSIPLKSYVVDKIFQSAIEVLRKNCLKPDGSYHVTFLGLSISNFENIKNVRSITSYFGNISKQVEKNPGSISAQHEEIHEIEQAKTFLPENRARTNNSENDQISKRKRKSILNYLQSMQEIIDTGNETNPCKPISYITDNLLDEKECTFARNDANINSESKIMDYCETKSIYSESTLSLNENQDDLVFYDDGYRDVSNDEISISARLNVTHDDDYSTLHRSASASSIGSIEKELYLHDMPGSSSPVFGRKIPEDGFFSKYFENIRGSPPVDRNFDTSKILAESDSEDCNSVLSERNDEFSEPCKECGDIIPIVDIVSHMDYHLALKLSKEKSPLKKGIVEIKNKSKISEEHSKKRKPADPVKNSIVSFFKKENSDLDYPTELCSECNKRIKLGDLENHSDYHAAKKLHLELNSASFNNHRSTLKSEASTTKEIQRDNKSKPKNSIKSFFKQKS